MIALLLCVYLGPRAVAQHHPGECDPELTPSTVSNSFWKGSVDAQGRIFEYLTHTTPVDDPVHALGFLDLIISGLVDGDARTSMTLAWIQTDFTPGPLDTTIDSLSVACRDYGNVWTLEADDLDARQVATSEWPVSYGAPYVDEDGNGIYEPTAGDYPALLGDAMAWTVFNDRTLGTGIRSWRGDPMQLEIRASVFMFERGGAVGQSAFVRYEIVNRSQKKVSEMFLGHLAFSGLGDYPFIGSDTTQAFVFMYDEDDRNPSYVGAPPALGMGYLLNRSKNGVEQKPLLLQTFRKAFDCCSLRSLPYGQRDGEPNVRRQWYNVLSGLWKTGDAMTEGGEYGGETSRETRYMFAGDPVEVAYWSELNIDSTGTHAHYGGWPLFSTGPFSLGPGETQEVLFAVTWAQGDDHLDSIRELRSNWGILRDGAESYLIPATREPDPAEDKPAPEFAASIYPNPSSRNSELRFGLPRPMDIRIEVFDALGRRVADVIDSRLDAGDRRFTLPTADWPPGVYLVRMQLDHITETRRLVVAN